MSDSLFHMIFEKRWPQSETNEKSEFSALLTFLAISLFAAFWQTIDLLLSMNDPTELIIPGGMTLLIITGLYFFWKKQKNTLLNITFVIPLLVYTGSLSGLADSAQIDDTVITSAGWLFAGSFFLFFFSQSKAKIFLYLLLSTVTLIFQLLKANQLHSTLFDQNNLYAKPLIIYVLINAAIFLLIRMHHKNRSELEEKLKELQQGVSKIIRGTSFPVAGLKIYRDEDGNVVRMEVEKINPAFESSFNIRLHEVKNQEVNYILDLVFKESLGWNNILLFNNKKIREIQASRLGYWFKIHILNPDFHTYYIIFEDITAEKKKREELESSKKRYKVLLEAIPDMFFVIGKDGMFEDFVIKESDLFKIQDTQIVGSTIYDVGFPPNMAERILKCIQACLSTNSLEVIEYSMNTPNGTYLYEMRLAMLNAQSVIAVSRDITRRKNAEFNLERARKKAEESDRLKSAFLSNLSHEIRTPLNIITNYTRMLTEEGIERKEQTAFSDAIFQNGTQLMNMIENTIHLSKIETDAVEVQLNFCAINSLIRNIYNQYRSLIPLGREVKMYLDLDVPNADFGFITDYQLLQETLQILVDNAVKYTIKGEVRLGYEMQGTTSVKFFVSDTGIGIPKKEIEYIFSRFYRAKNDINDITSGSGIGLPIAQHYVQILGGELSLNTIPEQGTSFSFSLPYKEGKGFLRVVS